MIENKLDIKYVQILPAATEGATKNNGMKEIYSM